MNERIRELAEQADIKFSAHWQHQGIDTAVIIPSDLKKFAELIIQECADICNKIYFDRYPDAEDFERSEEGDAIKNHFGVEL